MDIALTLVAQALRSIVGIILLVLEIGHFPTPTPSKSDYHCTNMDPDLSRLL